MNWQKFSYIVQNEKEKKNGPVCNCIRRKLIFFCFDSCKDKYFFEKTTSALRKIFIYLFYFDFLINLKGIKKTS